MTSTQELSPGITRRSVLAGLPAAAVLLGSVACPSLLFAQDADAGAMTQGQPFSFDLLTEAMRDKARQPHQVETLAPSFLDGLQYDDYRLIQFRRDRARWSEDDRGLFRVHAFHLGWLFNEPVHVAEVVDGRASELVFSTDDFEYFNELAERVPEHTEMPGVAGFRLNFPLNRSDILDEVVAFVGASYFRALGQGNSYGISARGLAINTGLPSGEEFPRFSHFWLERPAPGAREIVVHAALESPSVTGAYRFVITPGVETVMEVTARLFFRADVEQLGIAPLTSMFLYDEKNRSGFDDYRPQVHDSNGLHITRADGETLWRPLNNPPRLASSYFTEANPQSFGLHQRDRDFDLYQDKGARYEARPSLNVEPLGDWGLGAVRLVEIPTDLEVNDNIVAFWVPDTPVRAGDEREYRYRLRWGNIDPDEKADRAWVHETRAGAAGAAGVAAPEDQRKFVIDFKGGMLGRLPEDAKVEPAIWISQGEIVSKTLYKLPQNDMWRLVLDVQGPRGSTIELVAHIAGYDRKLSETWLYQWMRP
ncbi:glucan biosynthesis protein [Plastorhodobacter daqingensis]|uniref:Glucan biosynthesis protein n=1 Tax=Plastorhodobacter daqingensis TaxID=1387281 RepID=A0ABW2UF85_9RHOB